MLTLGSALSIALVAVAFAAWLATTAPGSAASSAATTMPAGNQPTATLGTPTGTTVNLSWTPSTGGSPVGGYEVRAYDAGTEVARAVGGSCAGVVTGTSCTDTQVPNGSWRYSVTPRQETWAGAESVLSDPVVVDSRPVVDITFPAAGGIYSDASWDAGCTSRICGTAADAGGGVDSVAVSVRQGAGDYWNGSAFASATEVLLPATGTTSWNRAFSSTNFPAEGGYTVRAVATDGLGNTGTASAAFTIDRTAPTIARAVAARPDGSTPGTIRQGGDYHLYAQVTDNNSVSTVTADASSFDTGVSSASLSSSGGPWTVGGQTYNYRSAMLTASTPLNTGSLYPYTVTATDGVGNTAGPTAFSVAIQTYADVIASTAGLVSHWRMGDSGTGGTTTVVSDTFTEFLGLPALLQNHTGETGASWTRYASSFAGTDAVTTALTGSLRRDAANQTMYYASGVPASADYSVQADVLVRSILASDQVGVIGRASTSSDTYYRAGYFKNATSAQWELSKAVGGELTLLGSYPEVLTGNSTHAVKLDMRGSRIRLLVDGIERASVTDTSIADAGRGGLRLGTGSMSSVPTDLTGLHLDNFTLTVPTYLVDSAGTNDGTYANSVTLGASGALAGDANTAAQFDGVNDYAQVPDAASLDLGDGPLTLEAWVRRNDTAAGYHNILDRGGNAFLWGFFGSDYRLSQSNVGTIAGFSGGASDTTAYHHWVATKNGAAVTLYRDGVDVTPAITNRTLVDTTSALYFAAKAGGATEFLNARLDEIAVYNQVLPAATVLDHYNAGKGSG